MAEKTNETTTMNTDNVVMFKERKRWLFFGLPFTFTKYTITADGLIIEVHNDPPHALCDGAQSLTPQQFDTVANKVFSLKNALK